MVTGYKGTQLNSPHCAPWIIVRMCSRGLLASFCGSCSNWTSGWRGGQSSSWEEAYRVYSKDLQTLAQCKEKASKQTDLSKNWGMQCGDQDPKTCVPEAISSVCSTRWRWGKTVHVTESRSPPSNEGDITISGEGLDISSFLCSKWGNVFSNKPVTSLWGSAGD